MATNNQSNIAVVGRGTEAIAIVVTPPAAEPKEEEEEAAGSSLSSSSFLESSVGKKPQPPPARKSRLQSPPSTTGTPLNNSGSAGILADKRRIAERKQQHVNSRHNATMSSSDAAVTRGDTTPRQTESTATTRPGAIHIQGWGVRDYNDDSEDFKSFESSSPEAAADSSISTRLPVAATSSSSPHILSALLVDEDEVQRHAETLLEQMLAKAVVAELVDEEEMRQRAREQAVLEYQQEKKQADDTVAQEANNMQQQKRLRFIVAGFCCLALAAVISIVVAVFLGQGELVLILPSFSPSTAPSAMPIAALSWRHLGRIGGSENLGYRLGFSADGNTVIGSSQFNNVTHQVYTYTYDNEIYSWAQRGQIITPDFETTAESDFCMSPNGKFIGIIYLPAAMTGATSLVRIFALREDKKNATITEDDTVIFWEQIGPDIVYSLNVFWTASLTDNLVLAIGSYDDPGLIHTYQFDEIQSNWVRMGQELQFPFVASMQLVLSKSTGGLLLAVGGRLRASTFRYESDTDSWIQFGSILEATNLTEPDQIYFVGVEISLSMDGMTLTMGAIENDYLVIGLLRTFSYDAAADDWLQWGNDLKGEDSSFIFGTSFALSANGKVLVATTIAVNAEQVRTWDFIAHAATGGGEWIQRGSALQLGTLQVGTKESAFGNQIALSVDASRFAVSGPLPLHDSGQGDTTGQVWVFGQIERN